MTCWHIGLGSHSTSWDYIELHSSCSSYERRIGKTVGNQIELEHTSLGPQCSFRTSFPLCSHARIRSTVASSSFSFFISKLWPPLLVCFFRFSSAFSTNSMSLMRSSSLMMSRSLIGSTSPSMWIISASSKHRTTWKMASTALICDRKALPKPAPVEDPLVKPAMS